MELGDLKKWHIGLGLPVFFAVLVLAYLMIEPSANPRTTSVVMFEYAITSKPVGKTNPQPRVQDIHVFPPVNGLYVVNFKQLIEDRKADSWKLQEWSFTAKTPNAKSTQTIPEWLESLKKQYPDRVSYTYEWWREPARLWAIWGGVSGILLLWGVVIPSVVWFAKGGAKEFKQTAMADEAAALGVVSNARSGPTAEDQDKLDEMLDRLEEETAGVGIGAGAAVATAGKPAAPAAPAVLTGKPLEAVAVADKEEDSKDYKGEFYPVARAGQQQPKS